MINKKLEMNAKDMADFLCVSIHSINRLTRQGKIPGYKIGGVYRYDKNEISEWLKAQKRVENE